VAGVATTKLAVSFSGFTGAAHDTAVGQRDRLNAPFISTVRTEDQSTVVRVARPTVLGWMLIIVAAVAEISRLSLLLDSVAGSITHALTLSGTKPHPEQLTVPLNPSVSRHLGH